MKKSFFWLIIFFLFLTTYIPKFDFASILKINIQEIIIENNKVVETEEIKQKISFLNNTNLLFLNSKDIQKNLKNITFIESFSIKKIYPNKLKLIVVEKKPIAILHRKKKIFFISEKGALINFRNVEKFNELPTVFGDEKTFFALYEDLQNIKFPITKIKSFYFFESGRWDLALYDNKLIKLPTNDYLFSLENFMNSKNNINFNKYKIFDYRIKDQLILN